MKPTNRKLFTANLLILSDLTLGPFLQGQTRIAKLKSAYNSLIIKKAVYLQNHVSCAFTLDTSCIWPQMCPWYSFTWFLSKVRLFSDTGLIYRYNVLCIFQFENVFFQIKTKEILLSVRAHI